MVLVATDDGEKRLKLEKADGSPSAGCGMVGPVEEGGDATPRRRPHTA
jgi:hypothetical protein